MASSVIKQVGNDNGVIGSAHDEGVVEETRKRGTWRIKTGKGRREVQTFSLWVILDTKLPKDARGQYFLTLASQPLVLVKLDEL